MTAPIGPIRQTEQRALDLQPFSIVEDKGFRSFVKALDPSNILPNRKRLSESLLPPPYDSIKAEMMFKVSNASVVCLTTDC